MDNTTQLVPPQKTEAMAVDTLGEQVATRIGFAERWLHRAKAQCADGNVRAGLLTLALADAEVRVALEDGGWPQGARSGRGRRFVPWLFLAAAAAAIAVWMIRPTPVPVSASATEGPPIIRLASNVGSLLAMVTVPAVSSAPAAADRAVPRPARRGPTSRPARAAPAPALAPAQPAVSTTTTATTTPAGPATASPVSVRSPAVTSALVVSEVDLIEMVLAADRTLRGTGP